MQETGTETPRQSVVNEHPFTDEGFILVVNKYAPEFVPKLAQAEKPTVSNNPDELEIWEANEIDRRKRRLPFESDFGYATRVLYEETFSVDQFPQVPFRSSRGPTVGGLISHFYTLSTIDGVKAGDAKNWELKGKTLKEALIGARDFNERRAIITLVHEMTYPIRIGRVSDVRRLRGGAMLRLADNPENSSYPQDMDTYGFRLAKLLSQVPEMNELVQDPELKRIAGFSPERNLTRAEMVVFFWERVGAKVINQNGGYKLEGEAGTVEGLRELLFVRTHPEMQFLYRFKSPSGHINEGQQN